MFIILRWYLQDSVHGALSILLYFVSLQLNLSEWLLVECRVIFTFLFYGKSDFVILRNDRYINNTKHRRLSKVIRILLIYIT